MAQTALIRRMRLDAQENVDVMAGGSLEDLIEMVSQTDSKEVLRCSGCSKPMVKGKLHPLIPVMVDRCGPCGEVWMDAGEYRLIRCLHKEMVTSEDPAIRAKLEKIAGVRIAEDMWKERRKLDFDRMIAPHSDWGITLPGLSGGF
jgi:hypothetical protein